MRRDRGPREPRGPRGGRGPGVRRSRGRRDRDERRSPLRWNSTTPSRIANSVSSRPMPTPGPGRNRVPRWRTMIIPALTSWPAKTSRRDAGSRSRGRSWRNRGPSCVHLPLLLFDRGLERSDRALALAVRLLVLERSRTRRGVPGRRRLLHVGDGEGRVPLGRPAGPCVRAGAAGSEPASCAPAWPLRRRSTRSGSASARRGSPCGACSPCAACTCR